MNEPLYPLLSLVRLRMGTDGSGVTTLVAGAGCPLHCRWCINARLLAEATAEMVTAETLLDRVKIDDLYFRATGGGICFGGGESLLHTDLIRRFREIAPSEWRITVETSLAVPTDNVLDAVDAVDTFIVDCKDMDPGIYHRYTGGDGSLMAENLRLLLQKAGPDRILVRVPLIPQYNTAEDQARSAEVLRKAGVRRLDLFSYVVPDRQ
ncbi:MAG: radical SAM protein [Lachnospiraceae bacterium]|nr:radical SAM protein [Lachnospiraceae bacterium]